MLVAEERLGRLGRVLSGWTPRWHWTLGVFIVSGGQVLLALALAGLVCGLGMAAGLDESDWIGEAVRAHLVHAAPVVLVAWLAAALGSWRPALQPIAWAVVAWGLVAAVLGDVLDLPEWGLDRSPWRWVGEVPVDAWQRARPPWPDSGRSRWPDWGRWSSHAATCWRAEAKSSCRIRRRVCLRILHADYWVDSVLDFAVCFEGTSVTSV